MEWSGEGSVGGWRVTGGLGRVTGGLGRVTRVEYMSDVSG